MRSALAFIAAGTKAACSTSTPRLEPFGEGKMDTTSTPAYNVNKMKFDTDCRSGCMAVAQALEVFGTPFSALHN